MRKNKKGYILITQLKDIPPKKELEAKNFNDAQIEALEFLKQQKTLNGKFNKEMNIKLMDKATETKYKLKWNKHFPLAGFGGYFSTFEYEGKKSSEPNFLETWCAPLLLTMLGLIVLCVHDYKKADALIKFAWFIIMLVYSALIPFVRANFNKKAKSIRAVRFYNISIEAPVWIAAGISLVGLFNVELSNYTIRVIEEGATLMGYSKIEVPECIPWIILGGIVLVLFFVKFIISNKNEEEKFYYRTL
ncbi:hypothetical protein CN894_11790 [Bacillus thuringiensis]|uniref:hypothetical protein n=1 Tax=Bacillus thuringiensis TaxID=1428 RepID=UPI000BFE5839|nr:hypothetical protein [Bacillus thuringiensis]PGH72159.1 hypothetical protein CN894_11790 [Bacillus thuringiensis]